MSEATKHRDRFRGRCALAQQASADVTSALADAIRISPMTGCVDVGTIDHCRDLIKRMERWLEEAEESAKAVAAAERIDANQGRIALPSEPAAHETPANKGVDPA